MTNSSQTVTGTLTQDGFGNYVASTGSSANPYMYAATSGYRSDGDAGLSQVGARCYDARAIPRHQGSQEDTAASNPQKRSVMSDGFLFSNALKDLLRPKKLLMAALLAITPCLIALAWRAIVPASQFKAEEAYNRLSEMLIFGFLLVILACVFATSAVSQEVEQKTVVYLLTRPIPRWRILLMKFAATFVVTTAAVWLASLLLALTTYGVSGWGGSPVKRDLLIAPIACLAYGALFLLLATLFNRPLILGLLYAFGVETWLPTLPGNFKMLSLLSYVHVLAPHAAPPPPETSDNPFALTPAATDSLTPLLSWGVVMGVIVVGLMAACFVFSNREYVPREDV